VDGYAFTGYPEPRFTKNIDSRIAPTDENAEQVWQALAEFDAPLEQVTLDDFQNEQLIYQIGIVPNRIDIIMDVSVIDFKIASSSKAVNLDILSFRI